MVTDPGEIQRERTSTPNIIGGKPVMIHEKQIGIYVYKCVYMCSYRKSITFNKSERNIATAQNKSDAFL